MFLIQYVNAFIALGTLMEKEMDYKTEHAVVMLRAKLRPHADFFAEKEGELAREYAVLDENGRILLEDGGRFSIRSDMDGAEYQRRREALGMVEVEDITPVRAGAIREVKPSVLEALIGFLEFEEENTSSTASGPPSPQGEGVKSGSAAVPASRGGGLRGGETI